MLTMTQMIITVWSKRENRGDLNMPGMKKPMRKMRGGMGMKKKAMRGGGSMMMKKPVMAKRGKAMRKKK